MKGIYVTTDGSSESAGVEKKIENQIKVLSKYGEISRVKVLKPNRNSLSKVLSRLPGGSTDREYDTALEQIKASNPDYLFFRGIEFDRRYISFIRNLKREIPKAKIVFEVPTYPYGRELLKNKTMWPWFFKDSVYRLQASRVIDRIVTYSDDDIIFGIPTIKVKNGIIVDNIKIDTTAVDDAKMKEPVISLLAVAQMQKYHGYDRLFRSIADYYNNGGNRKIHFDIVGDGNEKDYYYNMVMNLGIEDYVTFHGRIVGDKLSKFYYRADIGVGSFSSYRIGVYRSSNLKVREYLAYGLPVISGCVEDIFENASVDFYKGFPNDNSNIKLSDIIDFYDNLYGRIDKRDLKTRIREFAKKNADMEVVMQPIIDYLRS